MHTKENNNNIDNKYNSNNIQKTNISEIISCDMNPIGDSPVPNENELCVVPLWWVG